MIRIKRPRKAPVGVRRIHAPADQEADFIAEKVMQARRLADKYIEGGTKLDSAMFAIMACAMELHDKFVFLGEMEASLRATLKRENIKVTKNTTSSFIPLMKLVAPHLPSSTRGRSASILSYANANEVGAAALHDFVLEAGGIVKCAKAANAAKAPQRKQKRAEKNDAKVNEFRKQAQPLSSLCHSLNLPDGFIVCLLEKNGAHLDVLSAKVAISFAGFLPLEAQ